MTSEATPPMPSGGHRLDGKVALVTGGGGEGPILGIGRAACRFLAAQGAVVGVLDRNAAAARNTVGEIETDGGAALAIIADLTVEADCIRAAEEALGVTGAIDVLVNNAAFAGGQAILGIDREALEAVIALNLIAPILMTKHCAPHMPAGGAIVNISSIASQRPGDATPYGVTKAGLEGLTRAMAMQLGARGIRANCVRIGAAWSAVSARAVSVDRHKEFRAARIGMNLLGIEGNPWDVAEAIHFFASGASRWVTGEVLTVDAGGLLHYDRSRYLGRKS